MAQTAADDAAAAAIVGRVAAPGDTVLVLPSDGGGRVAISGASLRPEGGAVVASKCGVVRRTRGGQLWIEGRQKRCALCCLERGFFRCCCNGSLCCKALRERTAPVCTERASLPLQKAVD